MQECEFVVVSDGAPEEENSICEEYVNKDARFKFFRREHAGVSAARNFGIEHAQGEYIVFVDSDDKTTKDFCSAIYSSAKKWNSDILLFEQNLENRNTVSTFSLFKHDIPLVSNLQYKNLIEKLYFPRSSDGLILAGVCCKAYRRLFIRYNHLQFQPELHYSEDQLFCLNAFLTTNRISYLSKSPFYIQVCRNNSASLTYKVNYEKEISFYLETINYIVKMNSDLISAELFYDRAIQCILYTLDKCIYRPDKDVTIKQRRSVFFDFLSNPYCEDSLVYFKKSNFSFAERIACHLCKKKAFWTLFLVSKKWHIQRFIESFRNN